MTETSTPDRQLRTFLEGEGDRYFERNGSVFVEADPATDPPLRLIESYGLHPRDVLEIGCSNGYRLAAVARIHGSKVTGVEPSVAAVEDGRARFPGVRLEVGHSAVLPFDTQFDLVIVNFVLHWVDRSLLLRTVAEIDRVTADGGCLLIGDFYPMHPTRRRYHHLPEAGVFTYKQDYPDIFVASGAYQRVAMMSGGHSKLLPSADVSDEDRIATTLLRKGAEGSYVRVDE